MKKLLVLVFALAMVCSLLFVVNVSAAEEGTTVNIANEAEITTPTTSWWITQNLGRLVDGNETTGMHSSCHDRETTVNFKFASERNITKIVLKVNGTATTTAQNKENLNANTDYKITFGDQTVTLNAKDKTELVIDVNTMIDGFSIWFLSNWSGDNALIREVEVYEYIPPVVEAATGNNIEDEATITIVDGNDYILGGVEYLRDNDPSTGLSAGNAASWINYHFLYSTPRAITKVKVVVNSTGTMYMVGSAEGTYVHETMSNLPNIYLRLYDANGVIYKLENQPTSDAVEVTIDDKTYMEYTFDLGGALYEDVVKVEIATLHNKDINVGVWEVEIIDFQCQKDEDHKYLDATCVSPATCKFCGTTTGEPSDEHTLLPANCGKPTRCQYCDYTEGDVTGDPHVWMNASYTAPKTCKVCGATEGEAWVDSDLPAFVRGPENDTITYDDIVGEVELIAGSTGAGAPVYVLDGKVAVGQLWGGPTGSQIKITLKNEWEITDARIVIFANWAGMKISFYAADGTLLGEQNQGGLGANTDLYNGKIPENIQYTEYNGALSKVTYGDEDKAVKYIIITNTADKWGWVPAVYEVYFSGRERIPSNCSGHVFEATYPVVPTCTTEGTMVNVCTKCGEEEAPVVAPALGHNMGDYTVKVPADCDTAAVYEYACTRCGVVIERPTHIQDVTDYADIYSIGANGAGGNTSSARALFDNNMESYLHASGQWFVESWIELDMPYYLTGVTVWTGAYYDNGSWEANFTFWYQAPGSDEWIEVGNKAAGVIKGGVKYEHTMEFAEPVYADAIKIKVNRLASFAGQAFEAEVAGTLFPETAPLGHTWEVTETVAAACDAGYTLSTCTVCGETKTDAYTKAVGHIWANATCTAPKTCTVCAITDGDALGHTWVEDYDAGYQPSTCVTAGYDSYICEVCGETKREDREIDTVNGHEINYSMEYDTLDATCVAAGYMDYTCFYCGESIHVVFEMNPEAHQFDWEKYVYQAPTCMAPGYELNVCALCDAEVRNDFDIDPDAHVNGEGVEIEGGYEYTCTLCQTVTTQITKGTADDPIEAVDGENTFVYYATGEGFVVYQYNATTEGTITVTVASDIEMFVGENLMGWYWSSSVGTTYSFEASAAGQYMIVISTDSETYTLPETFNVSFEEKVYPDITYGVYDIVIEEMGGSEDIIVTVPGDYVLTFGEDAVAYIVYGPYSSEMVDSGYEFTVADGEKVRFNIGTADFQPATVTVALKSPDNAELNGKYVAPDGSATFEFVDGVLTITDTNAMMPSGFAGVYSYDYNAVTGAVVLDPAGIPMNVVGGTIYVYGRMPLSVYVPPIDVVIGDTSVTFENVNYYFGDKKVIFVAPAAGEYVITVSETGMVIIEGMYGAEVVETPYVITLAEGESFEFIVSTSANVMTETEDTVVITVAPAHTHVEVEIPAVLPTPSVAGFTAGVKCADCDEVLVAPVAINVTEMADTRDPAFRIASANLSLQENISVNYWAIVTEGYNNPYMVFVFNDKEYIVTEYSINPSNGRLGFKFAETFPQFMASNIEAYVYAETATGEYSMNKILEYSVKQYCTTQLKKNDAALTTVISDVLTLGAMTQLYVDYNTSELVTDLVKAEGYTLTPTAFSGIPAELDKQKVTGTAANTDLKGASLLMGSSTEIKLTFASEDLANTVVKVNILGEEKSFSGDDFQYDASSGRYYIVVNYIRSYEYSEVLTATIELNGAQVGRTIEYSINTYLCRNVDKAGQTDAAKNLMKALYVYGVTIANYFN